MSHTYWLRLDLFTVDINSLDDEYIKKLKHKVTRYMKATPN